MIVFVLVTIISFAQNSMGAADDLARIAIAPVIHEESGKIPPAASEQLISKMRQFVSLNGMGALDDAPLFIIFPQVSVIEQQVTSTVLPMYVVNMDVSFTVADRYTGNTYNTVAFQVKGVGKTQDDAYLQGLKKINIRDGKIKAFMAKAQEKIVEYFNTQCDLVISRGNSLAAQRNYRDALALLNSVPPVCRECFDRANAAAAEIGKNMPADALIEKIVIEEQPDEKSFPSGEEIYLGNDLYVKLNYAEIVGDQTQVHLSIINKSDDEQKFGFSNHWQTLITDAKGHEHKLKEFDQANVTRNWESIVLTDTPCPVTFYFDKVKEIRFLIFYYDNNAFKFREVPIKN